MLYAYIEDGKKTPQFPLNESQVRRLMVNRGISIPRGSIEEQDLRHLGIHQVPMGEKQEVPKAKPLHKIGIRARWKDGALVRQYFQVKASDEEIERAWGQVRNERRRRLTESDWTQLPDADLTEAQREAWKAYRQKLRNITDDQKDPFRVTFPLLPEDKVDQKEESEK